MRLRALVAAAITISTCALARADTLAQVTSGTLSNNPADYSGQGFTVIGTGSYSSIVFNFYTPSLTPYAAGTAYLLSNPYSGTPSGLSTSVAGYLSMATASGGFYNFGSSATLNSGTTYYLYEDALVPLGAISGGSTTYAGGLYFFSTSNSSTFTPSNAAANFDVTGTRVVPEPSTFALLSTSLLGVGAVARRRFS